MCLSVCVVCGVCAVSVVVWVVWVVCVVCVGVCVCVVCACGLSIAHRAACFFFPLRGGRGHYYCGWFSAVPEPSRLLGG